MKEAGRIDACKVVSVIYMEVLRGEGTGASPVRVAKQWRTLDGEIIRDDGATFGGPERPTARGESSVALGIVCAACPGTVMPFDPGRGPMGCYVCPRCEKIQSLVPVPASVSP